MPTIAAGYAASILMICLFPRKTVWMERVVLPAALAAAAGMLLLLSPAAVAALFPIRKKLGAGSVRVFGVLSEQERILAELILDGHTETSAARLMNLSLNTQKGYRKNLYFKLDIHSKRELFDLANTFAQRRPLCKISRLSLTNARLRCTL